MEKFFVFKINWSAIRKFLQELPAASSGAIHR